MGKYLFKGRPAFRTIDKERSRIRLFKNENLEKFNAGLLGLGDIKTKSTTVEALAATFDLSGFTNFCSKVDPHLEVPEYLSRFLDWLFNEIRRRCTIKKYAKHTALTSELPFLSKFCFSGRQARRPG